MAYNVKRDRKKDGWWKATIDFPNTYARKGHFEHFETRYDAEGWLKAVKKQFGKK